MFKITIIVFLVFNTYFAFANDKFDTCENTLVDKHHAKSVKILNNTVILTKKKILNQHIVEGLKEYFKLSVDDKKDQELIKKVFSNIKTIAANAKTTNYTCYDGRIGFWCLADQLAIVPPPKTRVYLCPKYFKLSTVTKQIGTIIHEWFHRWGKSQIDYLPERYCYESKNLSSEKLIRSADQYMLFVYYVGSLGNKLACF